MKAYLIGYDLNNPGQDYSDLIEAIKNIGPWWHCLDSTWIVNSNNSAIQIRDYLVKFLDRNDELLVGHLSGESAWIGFDDDCSKGLRKVMNP